MDNVITTWIQPKYVVQLGLGKVGQELLRQVLALRKIMPLTYEVRYIGLADRSAFMLNNASWTPKQLKRVLEIKAEGRMLAEVEGESIPRDQVLSALLARRIPNLVIVDLTATATTTPLLIACRQAGYNIVLANKAPLAVDYATYKSIAPTLPGAGRIPGWGRVKHEATVGAGLPVISTLEALLASGDRIKRIEASVSGTLGYICAALDEGLSFSAALRRAHALGYTEPDPRDDLNGLDAARKALILARRMGLPMELAQVVVDSLIPEGLAQVSLDEFWSRLPESDTLYATRLAAAHERGNVLRHVALIEDGRASVGLREVAADSPLGRLRGSDSIFVWHTVRYSDTPLVVQGPGAGPQVTAAGVLADILSLAN